MKKHIQVAVWQSIYYVPLPALMVVMMVMMQSVSALSCIRMAQAMPGTGAALACSPAVHAIDTQVIVQNAGYGALLALYWIARAVYPALLSRTAVSIKLALFTLPWSYTGLPQWFPCALVTIEMLSLYLSGWPARRSDSALEHFE